MTHSPVLHSPHLLVVAAGHREAVGLVVGGGVGGGSGPGRGGGAEESESSLSPGPVSIFTPVTSQHHRPLPHPDQPPLPPSHPVETPARLQTATSPLSNQANSQG